LKDARKLIDLSRISEIKERMLFLCDRIKPGKNNVYVPFRQALKPQLPKDKAFDMTTANRFGSFVDLLPLINVDKRPMIIVTQEVNPITHRIPFALLRPKGIDVFNGIC
jgi:hypothetical protein